MLWRRSKLELTEVEVERQVIEVQLEAAQQSLQDSEAIAVPEATLEQLVATIPNRCG